MEGLFDGLFDINNDGEMDIFEQYLEFELINNVIDEDEEIENNDDEI